MNFDPTTLALMILAFAGAGAAAGVLAGLLGIGGGIVIVPVLLEFFALSGIEPAIRMHLAVGTSLATIIATSLSSIRSHHKRGSVDWGIWRQIGPSVAIGVVVGAALASRSPGSLLALTFAAVALLAACYLVFFPDGVRQGTGRPSWAVFGSCGAVIGTLSTMIGIGGGTMAVPTLVFFGSPIRTAIGTSSAIGLIIAVIGCLGFAVTGYGDPRLPPLSVGYVSLIGFAAIVPMTTAMAPVGARLAHYLPPALVRRLFAIFLVVAAVRLIIGNL